MDGYGFRASMEIGWEMLEGRFSAAMAFDSCFPRAVVVSGRFSQGFQAGDRCAVGSDGAMSSSSHLLRLLVLNVRRKWQ